LGQSVARLHGRDDLLHGGDIGAVDPRQLDLPAH
jgi:hypothetical protein